MYENGLGVQDCGYWTAQSCLINNDKITNVINPLKSRGVNWLHFAIQF